MDLPQELEFRSVKKQTPVIIGKESRQITAQNGTKFIQGSSGQTQIVFRIPNDENVSVDLSTMWITAEFYVQNINNTDYSAANNNYFLTPTAYNAFLGGTGDAHVLAYSDSIESCISRLHILVNGSELERFDYYQYGETILNAHTNNANFSNSIGSGCMGINVDPIEKHNALLGNNLAAANNYTSNKIMVSFPLRWTGVANLRSLVPTYMLGGGQSAIEIRLFLESALNFLVACKIDRATATANCADFNTTAAPTNGFNNMEYVLDNVRMNYDCVYTSDAYASGLRDHLASNQLQLPIDTYYQTQFNIPAGQSSWINQTISTQFSDISSVFVAFFRSKEQNNAIYSGSDRMYFPPELDEARLLINGKPYPAIPIKFLTESVSSGLVGAEAYQYLMKALKQNCSLEVIGNTNASLENVNNYHVSDETGAITADTTLCYPVGTFVGTGFYYTRNKVDPTGDPDPFVAGDSEPKNVLSSQGKAKWYTSPSTFTLGWSVGKSDYSNEFEMSGADLSKSSGLIQVQLKFKSATGAGYTAVVLVKHKRVLEIGLDSSQVIY